MKIFRQLCLLGLVSLQTSLSAEACQPFSGFYLGESIGFAINRANIHSSTASDFTILTAEQAEASSINKCDSYQGKIFGEIFGGVGYQFYSNLYLGGRVGINFSSFDIKRKEITSSDRPMEALSFNLNHETIQKAKLQQIEYTFDAKIGWIFFEKTMVFALAGVALNKPQLVVESTGEFLAQTEETITFQNKVTISRKAQKHRANFRWGAGVEQMLPCNMSVHLNYFYTDYGNLRSLVEGEQVISNADVLKLSADTKAQFKRHAISVGFSQYF